VPDASARRAVVFAPHHLRVGPSGDEAGRLDAATEAVAEAIVIRRELACANERAAGLPLAMSLAVQASIHRKNGNGSGAADAIDQAFRQVGRMAEHFAAVVGREVSEIGGRYVQFLTEVGRPVDLALVKVVKARSGVREFGPTSRRVHPRESRPPLMGGL
jgi:hypothetical protein